MKKLTDEQIGILKDGVAKLACGDTEWCFNHDSNRLEDYSECYKCLDLMLALNTVNNYVGKGNRVGKCDVDGTEIYDGDILKYPKHDKPYCVVWCDDQAGFVCEHETNFMLAPVWNQMKVIGNMRCNPELMGYK